MRHGHGHGHGHGIFILAMRSMRMGITFRTQEPELVDDSTTVSLSKIPELLPICSAVLAAAASIKTTSYLDTWVA
jgi:hypothetical protein